MMTAAQHQQTLIIGGGAIGLSIAYHLAQRGHNDITLLERHEISSGTSWHAAGIIGPLRANKAATNLAAYAPGFFHQLEMDTGTSTGYQQTGGWWLSQTPARDIELKRIAALGQSLGFNIDLVGNQALSQREAWLNTQDIRLAMWVAEDGQANPVDICQALSKGAKRLGVQIRQDALVTKVEERNSGPDQSANYQVTLLDGSRISCQHLIICAGMWSNQLLQQLGIYLPLMGVEHMYVVTDTISSLPNPLPITRDLDAGIYCKGDAGKMVLGGFEVDAKMVKPNLPLLQQAYALFNEDWQQFEPFIQAGLQRFPALQETGIHSFINGPESFTHDTQPLLGPIAGKTNLYVACGMNSLGIVSAPGVGKSMAEWLLDGQPQWDLLAQDVSRIRPRQATSGFMQERMREAVANQFQMHWPYKQPTYGRGLKRTPVHHLMAQQGAVFGCLGGWERPLWFAEPDTHINYSFSQQSWWSKVAEEGLALKQTCGLMDLSPFTKLRIAGPHALAYMQHLCSRHMDIPLLASRYCLILNQQAGIIADVTVTRLTDNEFVLIAAAATQTKLVDWCQQNACNSNINSDINLDINELVIEDISQQQAVFAVAGPHSHQLLDQLCDINQAEQQPSQLGFGQSAHIAIAMVPVRISRLSFVGENGYELYCPNEYACHLYEQLSHHGQALGLRPIGLHTIDACRMEKGFVHWGHDIGPADNPVAANLMLAVDLHKSTPFIGQNRLQRLAVEGCHQTRVLLQLDATLDDMPLLYHDEPVYLADQLLGHTTSGALGARTQRGLCMAYLDSDFVQQARLNNKLGDQRNHCHINIAGDHYPANIQFQCPYDPQHSRMRGTPDVQY